MIVATIKNESVSKSLQNTLTWKQIRVELSFYKIIFYEESLYEGQFIL